jgi:hypothetical protein
MWTFSPIKRLATRPGAKFAINASSADRLLILLDGLQLPLFVAFWHRTAHGNLATQNTSHFKAEFVTQRAERYG